MEKFFNTSGTVRIDKHYCLDPLSRVDWPEIQHLIDSERYFVLHAPRPEAFPQSIILPGSVDRQAQRATGTQHHWCHAGQ